TLSGYNHKGIRRLTSRFAAISGRRKHALKPQCLEAPLSGYFDLSPGDSAAMTHVVCQPCFGCKYTDCVTVCPVECFYEGEQILYIHPEECIDCEACVPECPVEAIFHQDNVPEEWKPFIELNAEMAPQCPNITEKKEPLV